MIEPSDQLVDNDPVRSELASCKYELMISRERVGALVDELTALRALLGIAHESDDLIHNVGAFWEYVKREAHKHQFRDGMVEWWLVEENVNKILGVDPDETV